MADIVVPGFTEPSTARLKRRLNETSHFANQLVKHRDLGVNNNRSACCAALPLARTARRRVWVPRTEMHPQLVVIAL
jgi:hypothetical protein